MLPPALRRGDSPRFDPTGRLSQPNAEGSASQSSIAPSVDPSSVIPIDGQNTAGALESEVSSAPHKRSYVHAPGAVQSSPAPSLPVANGWPAAVPPMLPPALRRGDSTATPADARSSLDEGESPRAHSLEPFGAPRFDPTARLSQRNAEGSAAQSSIAPSVDPSSVIPIDGQKAGMLAEPPAAPAPPQLTSDDAQRHTSTQRSAATTVHVTIGRIELRAAAPAASTAASRPAANRPALSLADYLEQRKTAGPR